MLHRRRDGRDAGVGVERSHHRESNRPGQTEAELCDVEKPVLSSAGRLPRVGHHSLRWRQRLLTGGNFRLPDLEMGDTVYVILEPNHFARRGGRWEQMYDH